MTFVRHPHVAIFYPLTSLIYCASLRFSIVRNTQTSSIDWRFLPLDSDLSKHPPLFCLVVKRTQVVPADECHCFITKTDQAALDLVQIVSEIYGKLPDHLPNWKSPIFYQLDRHERRISETIGVIYMAPADHKQLPFLSDTWAHQDYLLDPSSEGFFYRTDFTMIESWQLWDDEKNINSRPRPPASPFGQRQALLHDDLTPEMQQHFRQMEAEHDDDDGDDDTITEYSTSSSEQSEQFSSPKVEQQISHPQLNFNMPPTVRLPIIIEKVIPKPIAPVQPEKIKPKSIRSKEIPMIDLNHFQHLLGNESDVASEIIEEFFENHQRRKTELTGENTKWMLKHVQRSSGKKFR